MGQPALGPTFHRTTPAPEPRAMKLAESKGQIKERKIDGCSAAYPADKNCHPELRRYASGFLIWGLPLTLVLEPAVMFHSSGAGFEFFNVEFDLIVLTGVVKHPLLALSPRTEESNLHTSRGGLRSLNFCFLLELTYIIELRGIVISRQEGFWRTSNDGKHMRSVSWRASARRTM